MTDTKVYTRGGDTGETSMLSGERVAKSDPHIAAVGDLDELSVALGFARLAHPKRASEITDIQQKLYQLSAAVSYLGDKHTDKFRLPAGSVDQLEALIDEIQAALPPLKEFIYPGQTMESCHVHQARVVARRVERGLADLPAEKRDIAVPFINRLSDLLFVMAREADHLVGAGDIGYRADKD